jgi:hypothetical protein
MSKDWSDEKPGERCRRLGAHQMDECEAYRGYDAMGRLLWKDCQRGAPGAAQVLLAMVACDRWIIMTVWAAN